MSRLRMQSHVEAVARDVHVVILEQLLHLRDQHIAPPLTLHPVDCLREAATGPAIEHRHAGRVSGIASSAAASATKSATTAAGGVSAASSRRTVCSSTCAAA